MKKYSSPARRLSVLACPVSSFAQSSVTLYGLIDEGFNYTSNVEHPTNS